MEALSYACARDMVVDQRVVLTQGSLIDTSTIASLAALGIDRVPVYDKPRISIVVVGRGFIAPGAPSEPGKVHDSNIPMLQAALETMRLRPVFVRRLLNNPKLLNRIIPFALNQSDFMILMIKDTWPDWGHIRKLLKGMNAQIVSLASGDELGKPSFIEDRNKKVIFYLPYDDSFIFKSFYKIIQPAIQFFMGYTKPVILKLSLLSLINAGFFYGI